MLYIICCTVMQSRPINHQGTFVPREEANETLFELLAYLSSTFASLKGIMLVITLSPLPTLPSTDQNVTRERERKRERGH